MKPDVELSDDAELGQPRAKATSRRGRRILWASQFAPSDVRSGPDRSYVHCNPAVTRDERRLLKLQRDLQAVMLLIVDELGYVPFWSR